MKTLKVGILYKRISAKEKILVKEQYQFFQIGKLYTRLLDGSPAFFLYEDKTCLKRHLTRIYFGKDMTFLVIEKNILKVARGRYERSTDASQKLTIKVLYKDIVGYMWLDSFDGSPNKLFKEA